MKNNTDRRAEAQCLEPTVSRGARASLGLLAMLLAVASSEAAQNLGPERIVSQANFDEYHPQVAYNPKHDEYLVVWHDSSPLQSRSVMGKRVDRYGKSLAEFTIAFEDTRDNAQPTVAYDADTDQYLVAWTRDYFGDDSDWDIYGRMVPWDGPVGSALAFPICTFSSKQWNPRVDFGATAGEFLVTWWNEGSGGVKSYVSSQRVTSVGVLAGGNFTVSWGGEERVSPDVSYNPTRNEYLVVYTRMDAGGGNIYGVRLSGTGSILGGGDFAIAAWPAPEAAPRVSASLEAGEWGVVWHSDRAAGDKETYARRVWVGGGGSMEMSTPVLVGSTTFDERNPDIAARPDSGEYLIAWEQQYSNASGPLGIFAGVLDSNNDLDEMFAIKTPFIGVEVTSSRPALSASPTGWFAVWEQERNATPAYLDIYGRSVFAPIFTDGFESGGLTAWSSGSP